jgi:putative transposase
VNSQIMALCGIKMRAWPTSMQKMGFSQWMGCDRFIYNGKCSEQEYFYKFSKSSLSLTGMKLPCDQTYSQFKTESSKFLEDCPSQILRNSAVKWYEAMQRFFKGLAGLPVRKQKGKKDSVWLTKELFRIEEVKDIKSGKVRKKIWIGTKTNSLGYLSFEEHREFKTPASITISKKNNQYYVSMNYEDSHIKNSKPEEVLAEIAEQTDLQILEQTIGLDRGIKIPLQSSDGRSFDFTEAQKHSIQRKQRGIRKWQRRLARQKLGSKRRRKQKDAIGRAHRKLAHIRKDFAHKTSYQLAESEYRVFVFEELNVKNMTKAPEPKPEVAEGKYLPNGAAAKAGLTRQILNSAWNIMILFLSYKSAQRNKTILEVNPHYSSQECAKCGHTHPNNRQSQESFCCIVCGHSENADVNAARVIKKRGLFKIRELYTRGTRGSARRGNRQTIQFKKRAGSQARRSENLGTTS